jgi:hypothetical protein
MEIVEQKYNNFVIFIKANIANSTYINMLSSINVETFLKTLKNHENKTPQEVTDLLCGNFGIKKDTYTQDVINKFERYIEYFIKVCKTM